MTFPNIDPVILHLWGPIAIRWYGLAYLLAGLFGWYLGLLQIKHQQTPITRTQFENLMTNGFLSLILGGRFGYMLFYQFNEMLANPWSVFHVWEGGMSFHGAGIALIIYLRYFCRKQQLEYMEVTDFIAPLIPMGLAMGRLANFINAELLGRITNVPWAMVFPNSDLKPRHPSQLYEMMIEGVVLFCVMQFMKKKQQPKGYLTAIFLIVYASGRFILEFYREPDIQLGYLLWDWLTMGQLLSLPMLFVGGVICIKSKTTNQIFTMPKWLK